MREFSMPKFAERLSELFQLDRLRASNYHLSKRACIYVGGLLSAVIHLIVFLFIFTSRPDNLSGVTSNSLTGSGNDTSMLQSIDLVTVPLKSVVKKTHSENGTHLSELEILPEVDTTDTFKPTEDVTPPKPNEASSSLVQIKANDVSKASNAAANGSPDGTQTILTQIARCLPPGSRPVLVGAQLHLELDKIGALLAVPKVSMDLATSSKGDVKSANQIIQAALQCGPYSTAQNEVRSFTFSPDFSSIP